MSYVGIIVTFVFVQNFALNRLLGICPFIGVSRSPGTSLGLGVVITVVSALSALAARTVYHQALLPLGLTYLETVSLVLIAVALVRLLGETVRRASPGLHAVFGGFLPLVTTNCVVLGIALVVVRDGYGAAESIVAGLAAGAGYFLALGLMAALRDSLRKEWVPKPFRGVSITFISAGLMSLAFMAFDRALLKNLFG